MNCAYKIVVNKSQGWNTHGLDACSLDISMGNPNLTGQKFLALALWANERFQKCIVNLGDTLNRHNLPEYASSPFLATQLARKMGDEWLKQNDYALKCFTVPFAVERWDHWLGHPEFAHIHETLKGHYQKDVFFRSAIDSDILTFMRRNQTTPHRTHIREDQCRSYLLEELAVYILKARENRLAQIYPASPLDSIRYLASSRTPEALRGYERTVYIRVDFKKRRSFVLSEAA